MSDSELGSGATVGQRLKAAREAKKLSLADVASQTRIPIRHLQHIEEENWEAMPALTYSIGFARSYANAVGLNGNEIGAELRQQLGTSRATYEAPSYYEPADPARVPPSSLAYVAAGIALVLIVGYIIWRSLAVGAPDAEEIAVAEAPVQAPVTATPAQPSGPTISATGAVVIAATDEVWLRISEAGGGASLFEGIMRAGDLYQIPATAQRPQIRTGRPQALRVSVGGTEIPPLGQPEQTIDNVSLLASDLAARASAPATPAPVPAPAQ